MKKLFSLLTLMFAGVLLVGCAGSNDSASSGENEESQETQETSEEKTSITVGGTAISVNFYEAIKDKYEELGYETEFVTFDSNPVVLEALSSGEIDMALGQHKRYMETFNENNDATLDMVQPYGMYTGIGLYSEEYGSADDIPDGAEIAVMNDPMNENIALNILQDEGLIELREDTDEATVADIIENPKNLSIIEMDQAQTVTALEDMAAATVFFTHMSFADKDPADYIARDQVMINYPMGVIVQADEASSNWAVEFAEFFRDSEVQDEITETFPGVFEFYTSDDQVEE